MILVVGGTGTLGRALVPLLVCRDQQVRLMSRTSDGIPERCDHLSGDVRDTDALVKAVEGCQTVISAVHGFMGGRRAGPEQVDHRANIALIDAAVRAGVQRMLLVSVLGAAADHPMSLMRAKFAAEQCLRSTDLAWTIVRPAAYLETWLSVVGSKVAGGGPALVFGRARNPINFVATQDVAAVIDHCLTHAGTVGEVIDVAGPENLTLLDLAAAVGTDRVRHVPRAVLQLMQYAARPISPAFARQARMSLYMDTADLTAATAPQEPRPHLTLRTIVSDPDSPAVRRAGGLPGTPERG